MARRDGRVDRKSTRLNSSHRCISYAVFCLKKNLPVPAALSDRPSPGEIVMSDPHENTHIDSAGGERKILLALLVATVFFFEVAGVHRVVFFFLTALFPA